MQKIATCLYFIVDMIVFTTALILLFCLSTLAQTDRKLSPKSFEEHSCLGSTVSIIELKLGWYVAFYFQAEHFLPGIVI